MPEGAGGGVAEGGIDWPAAMFPVKRGAYVARLAESVEDRAAALALRGRVFRHGACDADAFDAQCRHVLIEEVASGALCCCYRVLLSQSSDITKGYAAQFYDLAALTQLGGPVLELGRFCLHPERHDPDILRLAWAALTRIVDGCDVSLLFGCASFAGADPAVHAGALALLAERHLAPEDRRPGVRASEVVPLTSGAAQPRPEAIPPLLRSYLGMGGWVSDHAVIDRDLDTLHVFCGVEIAAIPPARQRLLRALAEG